MFGRAFASQEFLGVGLAPIQIFLTQASRKIIAGVPSLYLKSSSLPKNRTPRDLVVASRPFVSVVLASQRPLLDILFDRYFAIPRVKPFFAMRTEGFLILARRLQ